MGYASKYHEVIHQEVLPRYREYAERLFPDDPRSSTYLDHLEIECCYEVSTPRLCRYFGVLFGFLITHPDFPHSRERTALKKLFAPLDEDPDCWAF